MIRLDQIRPCLDGEVPSTIATCDADGDPNVTYLSQVQYVDQSHVALTFQFFNKTRRNILANPQAMVCVIHPATAEQFRLTLAYRRTEESGPLFETMKARLAAIAAQNRMEAVFHLRGADVYEVLEIHRVPGTSLPAPDDRPVLGVLRFLLSGLDAGMPLPELLDALLRGLTGQLDFHRAMLLLADHPGGRLFTIASHGYQDSGIGSEFPLGYGVVGTCAQHGTVIRIPHAAAEYGYSQAMNRYRLEAPAADTLESHIGWPGLANPHSQLAVPLFDGNNVLGVLFVESERERSFNCEDEDALVVLARWLERVLSADDSTSPVSDTAEHVPVEEDAAVQPLRLRYYPADHSVFLGQDYLIKGVAGAILWRLLDLADGASRSEYSNRELRLDPALKLPEIGDNLETRLLLLQRRLAERSTDIRIEKTGRGRFALCVGRPLRLERVTAAR